MTQEQQVIEVMSRLGGHATFGQLNEAMDFSLWGTKTPEATVRRIVQTSEAFFRLGSGHWALTAMQDQLVKNDDVQQVIADNGGFIYKKLVDKSVLYDGFAIPVKYKDLLRAVSSGIEIHGTSNVVRMLLDGEFYEVKLKNQNFDQSLWTDHPDQIQIRYGANSAFARKLQEKFIASKQYIDPIQAAKAPGDKSHIVPPKDIQEFLAISLTAIPNVLAVDCITCGEQKDASEALQGISEEIFESLVFAPLFDHNTGYTTALRKVRKLDKSIGDSLKKLYDYTCQVTGEKVGNAYEVDVVEAHHIVPFTETQNNDTSNIIILSPSFHRIVHKAKPHFNRENLQYEFDNGVIEKVKYDKHLAL